MIQDFMCYVFLACMVTMVLFPILSTTHENYTLKRELKEAKSYIPLASKEVNEMAMERNEILEELFIVASKLEHSKELVESLKEDKNTLQVELANLYVLYNRLLDIRLRNRMEQNNAAQ